MPYVKLSDGRVKEVGNVAANALVLGGGAEYVDGPPKEEGGDTPDEPEAQPEAEPEPELEPDPQGTDWTSLDWTSIDGVGEATAEAIVEYLEGSEIDSLDALADTDLTDLPEIGDAKRGAVESLLLEAMDADE